MAVKSLNNSQLLQSIIGRARSWVVGPSLERAVPSEADVHQFFHTELNPADIKLPLTDQQVDVVRQMVNMKSLNDCYEFCKKDNFKSYEAIRDALLNAMPEWSPIFHNSQKNWCVPLPPDVEDARTAMFNVFKDVPIMNEWQPEFPRQDTGVNWEVYAQLCGNDPHMVDMMEGFKEMEQRLEAEDVVVPFDFGLNLTELYERQADSLRPFIKDSLNFYAELDQHAAEIQELSQRIHTLRLDEILEACPDLEREVVHDVEQRQWVIDDDADNVYFNDQLQQEELKGREPVWKSWDEQWKADTEAAYRNFLLGKEYSFPVLNLKQLLNTTGTNPIVRPVPVEDDHHHH